MYKLILVDDEEEVRKGVLQKINWEESGYEIVGEAENGREALEIAEKTLPDVVITDIKMPFMDGLKLAEALYEKSPTTKVVVLTGFDEFEYAQKALRLNVAEYVLKPISAKELTEVLGKVKSKIDEERAQREDIENLREYYSKSLPLLREKFLTSLITTGLSKDEILEKSRGFKIDLNGTNYIVSLINIDEEASGRKGTGADDTAGYTDILEERALANFALLNIVEEIAEKLNLGYVFLHNDSAVIVTVSQEVNKEAVITKVFSGLEEIRQTVEKYCKFTVTIGVGSVCLDAVHIRRSYQNAMSVLDYRVVMGNNRIFWIEDIEPNSADRVVFDENKEHMLVSSIKVGTEEDVENAIDSLFIELEDVKTSYEDYQVYLMEILTSILKVAKNSEVNMADIIGSSTNLFVELHKFNSAEAVKNWLKGISIKVSNCVVRERQDACKLMVENARQYVKENYHESDITINGVCNYLHISPTYFSFIFKKETKTTFINYLTNVRMEAAKELLRTTNMKAFEIAEKVGYAEPNYFSYSFKKKFGQSPSEYRNSF